MIHYTHNNRAKKKKKPLQKYFFKLSFQPTHRSYTIGTVNSVAVATNDLFSVKINASITNTTSRTFYDIKFAEKIGISQFRLYAPLSAQKKFTLNRLR